MATLVHHYDTNSVTWLRAPIVQNAAMAPGVVIAGIPLVERPAQWAIQHSPAANTRATISRAAGGANIRHVCTSVSAVLANVAAGGATVRLNLRDGATGAGTILQSWLMSFAGLAIGRYELTLPGVNFGGSPNTAMTLEFDVAPGATNFETVSLGGYTVPV